MALEVETLEQDFLNYNANILQVLMQHRLIRSEEEEELRSYLTTN